MSELSKLSICEDVNQFFFFLWLSTMNWNERNDTEMVSLGFVTTDFSNLYFFVSNSVKYLSIYA